MNVYNRPLTQCSTPGYAQTGFTRSGMCEHQKNDHGNHHVCVSNISNQIGDSGHNFCGITEQPNWCIEKNINK